MVEILVKGKTGYNIVQDRMPPIVGTPPALGRWQ